ncbi:ubiquinol oxidase subunit II [Kushneria sp. AK178]
MLDPQGPIGETQKRLIITSTLLMLIVVIPVIIMTILFAWRYNYIRNHKYSPNWSHSNKIEVVVWGIPLIIIAILAVITWRSTHALDPKAALDADNPPITVQVMSMDWKWLFIYPEQGVASINQLAIPVNTPIEFEVTSSSVMNSFFVPRLGSQIYAMAGMKNTVHLMASSTGDFFGTSANYSGAGFSYMNFRTLAMTQEEFDQWVANAEQSSRTLDPATLKELIKPTEKNEIEYFSNVTPGLYNDVINSFARPDLSSQFNELDGAEE